MINHFDLAYSNDAEGVRLREVPSVVAFEFESGVTIKWNGSATFNVYSDGKEVDVFTHYGIKTADAAKESAEGWHKLNVENYNP